MAIAKALHVAILVTDLARAEIFYGQVLGLERAERSLNFPGLWYQIGAFQIHLIVVPSWQAPLPSPGKWGRNAHLALAVKDLGAVCGVLQAAGCPIQASASGRAAVFTQDPDGNVIEISQE